MKGVFVQALLGRYLCILSILGKRADPINQRTDKNEITYWIFIKVKLDIKEFQQLGQPFEAVPVDLASEETVVDSDNLGRVEVRQNEGVAFF